jgi:hypothetical protein
MALQYLGLTSEGPTLSQQAVAKMKKFGKKKAEYMDRWETELIGMVEEVILLRASFGEKCCTFCLEEYIYDLKKWTYSTTGTYLTRSENYELTNTDKDDLMTRVIHHYNDQKRYPKLICRTATCPTNAIFFSWENA